MVCHQRVLSDTHEVKEHMHSESWCYPDDVSAPITLTGAVGANTYGAWTLIIPAATFSAYYDIHYVTLENFSANDVYRVQFGIGATYIGFGTTGSVKRSAVATDFSDVPVLTGTSDHAICNGTTQALYARVKTAGGGSDTADISVVGHSY